MNENRDLFLEPVAFKVRLPREIWIRVVSYVSDAMTLMALKWTELKYVLDITTSNVWSIAHSEAINEGLIDANVPLYIILHHVLIYQRLTGSVCNEAYLECIHLFASGKCNGCTLMTNQIFWQFGQRLCHTCVYRRTVTDKALVHAFGEDDNLPYHLPSEYLNSHSTFGREMFNHGTKHFLYTDVAEFFGYDIEEDEDGLLDDFEVTEKGNHAERKASTLMDMERYYYA